MPTSTENHWNSNISSVRFVSISFVLWMQFMNEDFARKKQSRGKIGNIFHGKLSSFWDDTKTNNKTDEEKEAFRLVRSFFYQRQCDARKDNKKCSKSGTKTEKMKMGSKCETNRQYEPNEWQHKKAKETKMHAKLLVKHCDKFAFQ